MEDYKVFKACVDEVDDTIVNITEYNKPLAHFIMDDITLQQVDKVVDKLNELDQEVDRLGHCDDDANMEYFKRDAICGEVNYLLGNADRELNLHHEGTLEYSKIMGKIEVLNQLNKRIEEILG